MTPLAIIALAFATTVAQDAPAETVIPFAADGGIRNFVAGPSGSSLVYLQDRRLKWYRVTLSAPCWPDRSLQAITFKTDVNGTFDRFSQVASRRYPGRVCGVTSIVASPAPPGQPPRG